MLLPALLATIAVIALAGNTLVVILFLKNRKWLKKAHSCLILALAIQDILLAIGILVLPAFAQPRDVYPMPSNPVSQQIFCSLVWSQYIPFALGVTSVYTCLMLTIDRWIAVMKPISYRRIAHSWKAILVLVVIPWIAGFGFEITAPLNAIVVEKTDGSHACSWKVTESYATKSSLAIMSFVGMIVVPMVLMMVAYVQIIIRLKRSAARISNALPSRRVQESSGTTADQSTRRTVSHGEHEREFRSMKLLTRTAFGASALVIVCWLPDQIFFSLFQMDFVKLGTTTHYAVMILAFLNSCVNPFFYSFTNRQYREGFKAILCFPCVKVGSQDSSNR